MHVHNCLNIPSLAYPTLSITPNPDKQLASHLNQNRNLNFCIVSILRGFDFHIVNDNEMHKR